MSRARKPSSASLYRAWLDAQEACPHWDFEQTDGVDYDCCYDMAEAGARYRAARRREKQTGTVAS